MIPSISPDIDLVDETFNENRAPACALIIQLSTENFALAVLDNQESRYLAARVYRYPYHFNPDDFNQWLHEMVSSSFASWRFQSVRIFIANLDYTLIPGPLFNPSKKAEYIHFNISDRQGDMVIFSDRLAGLDAFTVFTVPLWLKDTLYEVFKPVPIHHAVSSFIESILNHYKYLTRNHTLFINIQPGFFDSLILHEHDVIFCNSFHFKSPDDALYYVMFVLEQLKLTPDQMELYVMGEMGKHAQVIERLASFLPRLDLVARNESFRYSHTFEQIPGHYLYNLLSAAACEL
jgi:hypothetical protein